MASTDAYTAVARELVAPTVMRSKFRLYPNILKYALPGVVCVLKFSTRYYGTQVSGYSSEEYLVNLVPAGTGIVCASGTITSISSWK